MDEICGADLVSWFFSATDSRRQEIIGYVLDDGISEWLIDNVDGLKLSLTLLAQNGITPTGKRKLLLVSAINESYVASSSASKANISDEIRENRSPLQKEIEVAYQFLLGRNWPAGNPLGMTARELASILKQLDGYKTCPTEGGIDRFSDIVEKSQSTARWGADRLRDFIKRGDSVAISLAGYARVQLSALYRKAKLYDEALDATSVLVTDQARGLSQSTIAALCITRAAALMDKFEIAPSNQNATTYLAESRKMLGRAYAINVDNEYQHAAFFRLISLEKQKHNS